MDQEDRSIGAMSDESLVFTYNIWINDTNNKYVTPYQKFSLLRKLRGEIDRRINKLK
jgi:hypothetical protein